MKKVDLDNPGKNSYMSAIASYVNLFSVEDMISISNKLYEVPTENRAALWKKLSLPLSEIENKFRNLAVERNNMAREKGYSSFMKFAQDKRKIPQEDMDNFLKSYNDVIKCFQKELAHFTNIPPLFYSEFQKPCYICLLHSFPLEDEKFVKSYVSEKYPILSKHESKIVIKDGESSSTFYRIDTDDFEITINKDLNRRYRLIDLLHEYLHVVNFLHLFRNNQFNPEEGKYFNEKSVIEMQMPLLKELSSDLYKAYLGHVLEIFQRVLFEIELYKNPNQKLDVLYAEMFNLCFNSKQKENNFYILDDKITMYPLSSLPHAVSYCSIIGNIINK